MHKKRLHHLIDQARAHNLDAVALVPGPNLFYLTGLSFHLSERPILAIFPVDGQPAIVLPKLEAAKIDQTDVTLDAFPYTDEEGHAQAFEDAFSTAGLTGRTIGAETLRIRLMEVRLLEQYAPGCELVPAEETLDELRVRKDEHEIEQMRRAIAATETALETTMGQIETGMTEHEIASLLTVELLQAGGETMAFSPIVTAGPNAASPHATPGDRPIRPGEPIIIDCGTTVGGYTADITRTLAVGAMDDELSRVYEIVRAANNAGRAAVRPSVPAEAVDQAARAVIDAAGYGEYFVHRTGHGLGLDVHEPPYITAGNRRPLEPGMVFTVEPGIYLPGRGGVRIEDDVLVTTDGAESLTTFTRSFIAL